MARMVRKQIYIPKRQNLLLRRLAKLRGVSEAELIREAIDRQVSQAAKAVPSDVAAWEQALAFMRGLLAQEALTNRQRGWTREELYEERERRYERRSA